jgi:hypothetical protein
MKPVSLADISYTQGLKLLYLRKQALDAGQVQRLPASTLANTLPMTSVAQEFAKAAESSWMDSIKNVLNKGIAGAQQAWQDPETRETLMYGLGGSGLGALGAGGLAAARGDKDWHRRAMQGALAGGVLGGGLGLIKNPAVATKHVEPSLQELAETSISPSEPSQAKIDKENLAALRANAGRNSLSATGPIAAGAGIGSVAGVGLNKALKGLTGVDKPWLAEQLLQEGLKDPNVRGKLESLQPYDVKKHRASPKPPAFFKDVSVLNPNNPANTFTTTVTELGDNAVSRLAKKLPGSADGLQASLEGLGLSPDTAKHLAEQAKSQRISSSASRPATWGGYMRSLRPGVASRRFGSLVGLPALGAAAGIPFAINDIRSIARDKAELQKLIDSIKK